MKQATLLALAGCLILFPGAAEAKKKKLSREVVVVPAGETQNEDIATRGPITINGTANGDVVAVGSSVTIRGKVNGDVVALGGDAFVRGTVNGDLVAIGGNIDLDGTVSGDAVSLGGTITLSSTTEINGDLVAIGGSLEKPEGATIHGEIVSLNPNLGEMIRALSDKIPGIMGKLEDMDIDVPHEGKMHERHRRRHKDESPMDHFFNYIFFLLALGGLAVIHMLAALLFEKPTRRVAAALAGDFWKAAGFGLLAAICFIPLLAFLGISIIGIPIIPLLFLLIFVSMIMGVSAVSLLLSERLYPALKKPQPGVAKSVGAGFAVLCVFFIVGKVLTPLGGFFTLFGVILIMTNLMLLFAGILMGLGAVIMTRLGTRSHLAIVVSGAPTVKEESDKE